MATVTIKISSRSKKAKYLLGLITELAKTDSGIEVIDHEAELKQAISEAKEGKTKLLKRRNV